MRPNDPPGHSRRSGFSDRPDEGAADAGLVPRVHAGENPVGAAGLRIGAEVAGVRRNSEYGGRRRPGKEEREPHGSRSFVFVPEGALS